jgi:hypothetical protein
MSFFQEGGVPYERCPLAAYLSLRVAAAAVRLTPQRRKSQLGGEDLTCSRRVLQEQCCALTILTTLIRSIAMEPEETVIDLKQQFLASQTRLLTQPLRPTVEWIQEAGSTEGHISGRAIEEALFQGKQR